VVGCEQKTTARFVGITETSEGTCGQPHYMAEVQRSPGDCVMQTGTHRTHPVGQKFGCGSFTLTPFRVHV
jgi:hypothetical protein